MNIFKTFNNSSPWQLVETPVALPAAFKTIRIGYRDKRMKL